MCPSSAVFPGHHVLSGGRQARVLLVLGPENHSESPLRGSEQRGEDAPCGFLGEQPQPGRQGRAATPFQNCSALRGPCTQPTSFLGSGQLTVPT